MSSTEELKFAQVQKQLSLMKKLQWKPKIQTWAEIKQTQFFKIIKKDERTKERIKEM